MPPLYCVRYKRNAVSANRKGVWTEERWRWLPSSSSPRKEALPRSKEEKRPSPIVFRAALTTYCTTKGVYLFVPTASQLRSTQDTRNTRRTLNLFDKDRQREREGGWRSPCCLSPSCCSHCLLFNKFLTQAQQESAPLHNSPGPCVA